MVCVKCKGKFDPEDNIIESNLDEQFLNGSSVGTERAKCPHCGKIYKSKVTTDFDFAR